MKKGASLCFSDELPLADEDLFISTGCAFPAPHPFGHLDEAGEAALTSCMDKDST